VRESWERGSPSCWSWIPRVWWRTAGLDFHLCLLDLSSPFLSFLCPASSPFSLPPYLLFQMTRNKRRSAATVPRRLDHLHDPVTAHSNQENTSVLALQPPFGAQPPPVPHIANTDLTSILNPLRWSWGIWVSVSGEGLCWRLLWQRGSGRGAAGFHYFGGWLWGAV
jgi:hypothetical protein